MDQALTRPLIDIFNEANEEARLADSHYSEALQHALNSGALLNEAKARVKHGEWLPLLQTHWKATVVTANRYMKLARQEEKLTISNKTRVSYLQPQSLPISQRQALEIIKPKLPSYIEAKLEPPPADRVFDDVAGRIVKYNWNGSDIEKIKELIKHRDQYSLKLWETVKDSLKRSIQSLSTILKEMEND